MKNKEKFAKEILDIVCNNGEVAMDKTTKKLNDCEEIYCHECYFFEDNYPHNTDSCAKNFVHWANAEYKRGRIFTAREKAFLKLFPVFQYIAKDKNGEVFAFISKPEKGEKCWLSTDCHGMFLPSYLHLDFLDIYWDDEEPTSREEILGKEKDGV